MGLVQSTLETLSPESFSGSLRAQKLHLAFREWSDVEIWSAFRRVRKLDLKDSLTLSQTSDILSPEFEHLLFLWDFVSEDDQSVDVQVLLSTICLFSGCPLAEKGRFLLCLFDRSFRGVITCYQLTRIAFTVNLILHKCFPSASSAVVIKGTALSVTQALPLLLPSLADVVANPEAFNKDPVVTAADMTTLLDAIQPAYAKLPCAETKFALRHKRSVRTTQH